MATEHFSGVTQSGERMVALDALRGFAVMGILSMNIVAFAMPEMAYFDPFASGAAPASDIWSWAISFILFDGKMRGLFSLLFGASMMLIITRAAQRGDSAAQVHFRRMAWLAAFGLLHFYLIWWGDILFLYAVSGSIAFGFATMQSHRLIVLALLIYAVGAVLMSLIIGSLYLHELAAAAPDATAQAVVEYQHMISELRGGYAQEVTLYQSGYVAIVTHRLTEEFWTPVTIALQTILETLPLMLIGMALMKNGFIIGAMRSQIYLRWAFIGIGIGVVGYGLLTWMAFGSGFGVVTMLNISAAWSVPFRLPMTLGYAALLIFIFGIMERSNGLALRLMRRIAAAGQAAFSNYLGTSIAMTTIFYGYGFGLFGSISRAQLWMFVLAGCVVMLLWSKPWLDHFRYGPLEWLWRSLARGRPQGMQQS